MHPLRNGSQVTVRPARKPLVGTAGWFSESNDENAPSYPGQDWFNDVIDEFLNACQAAGVTFDETRVDHLARIITNASGGARNLFEANQNFNVEGADGTLTSSPQTFTNGQEFSFGWVVSSGADLVDATLINGELTATSGQIQRAYPKDPAGLLAAAKVYGSVTASDGTQTYADTLVTNGVEVSEDSSNIYLTIDFSVYTDGVSIAGLSIQRGEISPISDLSSASGLDRLLAQGSFVATTISLPESIHNFRMISFNGVINNVPYASSLDPSVLTSEYRTVVAYASPTAGQNTMIDLRVNDDLTLEINSRGAGGSVTSIEILKGVYK